MMHRILVTDSLSQLLFVVFSSLLIFSPLGISRHGHNSFRDPQSPVEEKVWRSMRWQDWKDCDTMI